MSDSYLFEYENKFQILVFGINRKDARNTAKQFAPLWNPKFIIKNPSNINRYVLCATTEEQQKLNREKNRMEEKEYYRNNPNELEKLINIWTEIGLNYWLSMEDIKEIY